jgi:hypothetical protein
MSEVLRCAPPHAGVGEHSWTRSEGTMSSRLTVATQLNLLPLDIGLTASSEVISQSPQDSQDSETPIPIYVRVDLKDNILR